MTQTLLSSPVGRLRILGWVEGITLLLLIFIGVPLKYFLQKPGFVQAMGPVHGAAFLLFLFSALSVGVTYGWTFRKTTWKVILACFIPFGTFYIDHKILRQLSTRPQQ
jgi:integral membrane protein